MNPIRIHPFCLAAALALAPAGFAAAEEAQQEQDTGALARAAQNPVAAMISVPFQNNTNFNVGPFGHTQNVLNIQPVIPFTLNEHWNLITRTIIPVVAQPAAMAGENTTFGLGATQFSVFISPAQAQHGITWGAGAVVQAPTTTDRNLGSNVWGAGPSFVALTMQGPWVIGAVANNIWSFGGDTRTSYSVMTVQPFVNYNFHSSPGTYLTFSPLITANWNARSGQQWTVPLGLGIGQIFRIGHLPVNAQLGAYYNVVRPDMGPEWQIRFQLALLFPR